MEPELADIIGNTRRLLFVGVGNVLRSDDGVGVVICRQIRERESILALPVEVSIENYIGKINSLEPEEIVLLDCMDLGAKPGSCRFLSLDQIEDITFNTHNISIGKLKDFFRYPTHVLGIHPLSLAFGDRLSEPVQKTADLIIRQINQTN